MKENNVIGNIDTIQQGADFGIKSQNSPFAESFFFTEVYDDKAVKAFIKSVERLVRTSREYKTYIELLRTNIHALNHDSVMNNITTADVDLEFHHYPLSLYDIVEVCVLQHLSNQEKFTTFSIAKEIMDCHFRNEIGLVPLTKTMHELAHSGNLFLNKNQVFGDYRKFCADHINGLSAELQQKIATMEQLSSTNTPTDFKRMLQ